MNKTIPASELPLQADGAIYHLDLHPDELADNVILVGDPGRVAMISGMFDTVELFRQNREFITHTGTYKGKRISVISTGMGTDNIDIVLTELDALANVDLATRTVKETHRTLNLVRIGTSGALSPDLECGSFLASAFELTVCCATTTRAISFARTLWRHSSATQAGIRNCPFRTALPPRRNSSTESVTT